MTTAFKGKGKASSKGKGKDHKGKGFGKAKGKFMEKDQDPEDLHGISPQSLMAIKRPTKQTAKEKDRARSSDKVVHVPKDQIIGVSDSDQSINPEPRELRSTVSGGNSTKSKPRRMAICIIATSIEP